MLNLWYSSYYKYYVTHLQFWRYVQTMKFLPRKAISAALAVVTAATLTLSPLAAVIGSDLHVSDTEIHSGTVLSQGVYWGATANDKRT